LPSSADRPRRARTRGPGRTHFAKACALAVQFQRELAAARDYERLSQRAAELRRGLANAPIIATSDPLPAAFSATLGRVLPLGGAEGIALLFTMVVGLMSCCGLAGMSALYKGRDQTGRGLRSSIALAVVPASPGRGASSARRQSPSLRDLPKSSLTAVNAECVDLRRLRVVRHPCLPPTFLPIQSHCPSADFPEGGSLKSQRTIPEMGAHVPAVVRERPEPSNGSSVAAGNCARRTRPGALYTTTSRSRCQS
jgi:hypothetical protein